jgi:hypothetical protein
VQRLPTQVLHSQPPWVPQIERETYASQGWCAPVHPPDQLQPQRMQRSSVFPAQNMKV